MTPDIDSPSSPLAVPATPRPACLVLDLPGLVSYPEAVALQEELVAMRTAGSMPDILLLLEHPPVFTLGRRGQRSHIYAPPALLEQLGITVHQSSRGGLVTYHGPGQLVGYPITRLADIAGNVPAYVWGLEEVIIRALDVVGVTAARRSGHPGVWTERGKIAAIGVAVVRGITMHGFAINVQPDLSHFQLINPCGLAESGVTSVQQLLGETMDLSRFRKVVATSFGEVFGRDMRGPSPEEIQTLSSIPTSVVLFSGLPQPT